MPKRVSAKTGSELFIVDNSDVDWKCLRYLHDWCQISKSIDIATGYFEIGALRALDGEWQKVDQIRILMGDEVSHATKAAFNRAYERMRGRLDASIEEEKLKSDFLTGVPAIVEGIRSGKIVCRVYRKEKFHAKAYITHGRLDVVGSSALVGSSNFTHPGLTENIELNVQITGNPVSVLQEWFEQHWDEAEDATPDILRTIERHTREYSPFEVYAKSLQEFFRGHELTAGEWEKQQSHIYPRLDHYQKEAYHGLMKIASNYDGAFLCDGVGLGKTYVGLMIIERLVRDGKNVAVFVPKTANEPVWKPALKQLLPNVAGAFNNVILLNHTDLQRGGDLPDILADVKQRADAILIDEAHHFRNPGPKGDGVQPGQIRGTGRVRPSRYRRLYDLIEGPRGIKHLYLLTATPINNRLLDLQHMIELFSRGQPDRFRDIGIHSLPGHFRTMEKRLESELHQKGQGESSVETNLFEAEDVLHADELFQSVVIQRSRAYVHKSQIERGVEAALFPKRDDPRVAEYSVKKTYGKLLELVETAFNKQKPLFALAIYNPLGYHPDQDQIDPFARNRQKQVVGLIRTGFLKRFESSAYAFECSCERLLKKLLAFATKYADTPGEKGRLEKWKIRNGDLIKYVHEHQLLLFPDLADEDEEELDEDIISEEMLEAVIDVDREEVNVSEMFEDTLQDLDQMADFLNELRRFEPKHDDKLKALKKLLKAEKLGTKRKVLIFTEFAETARYLHRQLQDAGFEGIEQLDSSRADRGQFIRRFAPYYNGSSSQELADEGLEEIQILISTDVLSEGLNLQDATRLINYDIHWNPVRLMQRIGRVDRRMNPDIEAQLIADHPDQKKERGHVAYWNFLPPDELNALLTLYSKVSKKTLRISKTFGIEGRKLLHPEDDFEALKEFNREYEGDTTPLEAMRLELQQLFKHDPELAGRLDALPGRVFSGKRHLTPGTRAAFFCYRIPRADHSAPKVDGEVPWTEDAGETCWLMYNLADEKIVTEATEIIEIIRCAPDTTRQCEIEQPTLSEIRIKIDKHLKNTRLKQLQAPASVKPLLKAWMELN